MSYVVDLEAFHGPLDLLLYLIDKNEVDIYDIPIAEISDQYMEYLQATGKMDLDTLGDFLVMASYLLILKSRMLLPQSFYVEGNEDEEAVDPREELVKSLLDYRRFKKAAELLSARQEGEFKRVFFRDDQYEIPVQEEISVDIKALVRAYKGVISRIVDSEDDYEVPSGDVNVAEKMDEILEIIKAYPDGIIFNDLFKQVTVKREALALFLALLELIRLQKVAAIQEKGYTQIKVFLRVAVIDDDAKSN